MTRIDTVQETIQVNNFGGLNTTSSPISTPPGDARTLLNVDVDVTGRLVKRQGTEILYRNFDRRSLDVNTFKTYSNIEILTVFENNDLIVYSQGSDLQVYLFENLLFYNSGGYENPQYRIYSTQLVIPDDPLRVVYLFARNRPVQLSVYEFTILANGTDFNDVPGAQRVLTAPNYNRGRVFVNGVFDDSAIVSFNAVTGNVQVNISPSVSTGKTITLMYICCQAWVEAEYWTGDKFLQHVPRGNATPADQILPVPLGLRTDLDKPIKVERPFIVYYRNLSATAGIGIAENAYPYVPETPTLDIHYSFSDGTLYTPGLQRTIETKNFITFGANGVPLLKAYIVRARRCRFNGGLGVQNQHFGGYVNSAVQFAHLANTTYNSPWTFSGAVDPGGVTTTLTSTVVWYAFVSENATDDRLCLSANSECIAYNRELKWTGTGLYNPNLFFENILATHNAYYPIFGLGNYANFATGAFPAFGTFANGRVYLSGFPDKPGVVVASAVSDFYTPKRNYSFFQISDDLLQTDADPFEIVLDEPVIGLRQWQQFVFIFTSNSVYQLNGLQLTLVSSLGAVSDQAIVLTENTIYYIAKTGLYALPLVQQAEYRAEEVSVKVRSYFNNVGKNSLIEYVPSKYKLFIALDTQNGEFSDTLLVYDLLRQAWSEYYTYNGFNFWSIARYGDKIVASSQTPCFSTIIQFFSDKYIDYSIRYLSNGYMYVPKETVTLVANKTVYTIETYTNIDTTIEDIEIWYNGSKLVFNVDWVKVAKQQIKLLTAFTLPNSLNIYPTPKGSWYGNGIYASAAPMYITDPTVVSPFYESAICSVDPLLGGHFVETDPICASVSSNNHVIEIGAIDCTDQTILATLYIGQVYPVEFASPLFTSETFFRRKRLEQVYLFFDQCTETLNNIPLSVNDAVEAELYLKPLRLSSANAAIQTECDLYVLSASGLFANANVNRKNTWVLFKEPLQSIGYSHQLIVWSNDIYEWSLGGYQLSFSILSNSSYISGEA